MLVPVSVWGHHIFPLLQCQDFLALRCASRVLRDTFPEVLAIYLRWLLSEIQVLASLPALHLIEEQVQAEAILAKAELERLTADDLIEAGGFYRPPAHVLATAETVMLLFPNPERNCWLSFLRSALFLLNWLRDLDPWTPSVKQHLQTFETFLTSHSVQETEKMWKFSGCFYHYLEHIVSIAKLRSESGCEELELTLRRRRRELMKAEKLQVVMLRGLS
jgi:hypothetical protein